MPASTTRRRAAPRTPAARWRLAGAEDRRACSTSAAARARRACRSSTALPEAQVTATDLHAPFLAEAERRVARGGARGAVPHRRRRHGRAALRAGELRSPLVRGGGLHHRRARGAGRLAAAARTGRPARVQRGGLADRRAGAAGARPLRRLPGDDRRRRRAPLDRRGGLAPRRRLSPPRGRLGQLLRTARRPARRLAAQHGADPDLAETREEIEVRRAHGGDYGYGFFVAAP